MIDDDMMYHKIAQLMLKEYSHVNEVVSSTDAKAALQRGMEQILDLAPPLGSHFSESQTSSVCSQARAARQPRSTVGAEIPITSAVSATVSPPKKRSSTI